MLDGRLERRGTRFNSAAASLFAPAVYMGRFLISTSLGKKQEND